MEECSGVVGGSRALSMSTEHEHVDVPALARHSMTHVRLWLKDRVFE